MLHVGSKWKLAEKALSCRDRNGITTDQQELNRTKGKWNNSDSSHSCCSKRLASRFKRLSETSEGRIGSIEEQNLVPTIPVKIALDASNNSVNNFGGVGFSILALSLHYEATQFLYRGNSKKVDRLAMSFVPGFEDGYCS